MIEKIIFIFAILLCLLIYPTNNVSAKHTFKEKESLESVFQVFFAGESLSAATTFSVGYDKKTNDSILLTNFHFCESALTEEGVIFIGVEKIGSKKVYQAEIVKYDISKDLCLIKSNLKTTPLKINEKCNVGDQVKIVGAPLGVFPIFLDSYISKNLYARESASFLQIDVDSRLILVSSKLFPGHSGSPIFSEDGRVCGIVFMAKLDGYGAYGMSAFEIDLFINSYSDFSRYVK